MPAKEGKGRPVRAKGLGRLFHWLKPHLASLALVFGLILVVNGAELLKPFILKQVIDGHLSSGAASADFDGIVRLGLFYLAAIVAGSLFRYLQALLVTRFGQSILMNIRREVFRHILHLPMRILDRYSSGRLITRATNDVETLNEFFSNVLVNLFRDAVLLLGIIIMMILLDWQLALIALVTIPLIVGVTLFVKKRLTKNFVLMKQLIGRINAFFGENIAGMRMIQLFSRQAERLGTFGIINRDYFKSTLVQIRLNSIMRPMMEVINTVGIALLVWTGMRGISGGTLEIGVLYAFTTYIKQFFEPINDLAEQYVTIQSAAVSADRIFELLDQQEELEDLTVGESLDRIEGRIEFSNVWFAYQHEDWVLRDVSFVIEPGQKAAIVGATGAGKTTIIALLLRFHDCQQGTIRVDGIDIRTIRKVDLRRQIAIVLQDVFLFSGTIAHNIRLGDDQIDDMQVANALRLAQADHFIESLSEQMETPVTERGSTFSAGQRQLLSFARAIARQPAVFILDEATAQIDSETELAIQQSIEQVTSGRTSIIIAHRLSTIRGCDRILVMDQGQLAEQGSHEALLKQNGRYASLIRAQFE